MKRILITLSILFALISFNSCDKEMGMQPCMEIYSKETNVEVFNYTVKTMYYFNVKTTRRIQSFRLEVDSIEYNQYKIGDTYCIE